MADYVLNKTLSRPTTNFAWLSLQYDLVQTIRQPSILVKVNDWVLSSTLAQPTLVAEFESGTSTGLSITLSKPRLVSHIGSGAIFSLQKTLREPTIQALILGDGSSVLNITINRPVVTMAIGVNSAYQLIKTLAKPKLVFRVSNKIVSGSGSTYTYNLFNSAHTTFTNYNFNSYFKIGSDYYGINSTGVYLLSGDLDITTEIASEVDTPISDFGKQGLKACSDAIILGRLADEMQLSAVLDEQYEYTSLFSIPDDREGLHRVRVKVPKGLKGSVWQCKIKNSSGSRFSINSLELFLKELQRVK